MKYGMQFSWDVAEPLDDGYGTGAGVDLGDPPSTLPGEVWEDAG